MSAAPESFEDRLLFEEFRGLLSELDEIGVAAPDGAVPDALEGVVLGRGRKLLLRALEAKAQAAIAAAEKNGSRPARPAGRRAATRAATRAA